MQDPSESWLDTRLRSDDAWHSLAPGDVVVTVDDTEVDALLAEAAGRTFPDVPVVATEEPSWLAGVALDASSPVHDEEAIVIDDADLHTFVDTTVSIISAPGGIDEGDLGPEFPADLDDLDGISGEASTVVDPFEVFLAETAPTDVSVGDDPVAAGTGDTAADVVGAVRSEAVAEGESAGDDTAVPAAEDDADHVADDPDARDDGVGQLAAGATIPDGAPSVSRLDAFDAFDDPAPADVVDESFGHETPEDGFEERTDDTFGDDFA